MPLDADAQAGACPAGAALDAPFHAPSGRCGEPLIAAAGARPEARQNDLQIGPRHRAACSPLRWHHVHEACVNIDTWRRLVRGQMQGHESGKGLGCNCVIRPLTSPLTLTIHNKTGRPPSLHREKTKTHTNCTRTCASPIPVAHERHGDCPRSAPPAPWVTPNDLAARAMSAAVKGVDRSRRLQGHMHAARG